MARAKSNFRQVASGYMEKTHRPLNCLAFLIPVLIVYEVGALAVGHRLLAIRDLNKLLELFGVTGRFLPPALLIIVLLTWHVLSRDKWHIDADALVGMIVESVLLMVPLALLATVADLVANTGPVAAQAGAGARTPGEMFFKAVGAGIYEEFLFRLVGMSLILAVCVDLIGMPKKHSIVLAVILTAVLFGLYHSPVFGGETSVKWGWDLFVVLMAAGAYLAVVYVARGFGIAVGVHICHNIVVDWSRIFAG